MYTVDATFLSNEDVEQCLQEILEYLVWLAPFVVDVPTIFTLEI